MCLRFEAKQEKIKIRFDSYHQQPQTATRSQFTSRINAAHLRLFATMVQQALLRTARTFLTVACPASKSSNTCRAFMTSRFASSTAINTSSLRRPASGMDSSVAVAVAGRMGVVNGVQEQVRGMKVRSSVKKLCEGCKVC